MRLSNMETQPCTHPDHNDLEDCQDHAVACRPDCACCLCPSAIAHYAAEKDRRKVERLAEISKLGPAGSILADIASRS